MGSRIAKGAKVTFWNKQRIKSGKLLRELADEMGVTSGTMGSWCSGMRIPSKEHISKMCNAFNIDYATGHAEFVKANQEWESSRGGMEYVMYGPTIPHAANPNPPPRYIAKKGANPVPSDYKELLKYFYNKVSFAEYVVLANCILSEDDPLSKLYGKISFEDFNKVKSFIETYQK